MPLYEYKCANCSNTFEKLVRSSLAEEELTCPRCGHKEIKRLVSLFGVSGSSRDSGYSAPTSCAPVGGG
jgi:putative FmdB family regulatory protein